MTSQLIFDKGAKAMQWRRYSFLTNSAEPTRHLHTQK